MRRLWTSRSCMATNTPEHYPAGLAVWKAATRDRPASISSHGRPCPAEALLLDGPAAERYGGAGKTFDWTLARRSRGRLSSGGAGRVECGARQSRLARPWGVDACSRIESAPGIKDHTK